MPLPQGTTGNTPAASDLIGQELHLLWLYVGCTEYCYLAQRTRRMPRQPIFVSLSTTPINGRLSDLSSRCLLIINGISASPPTLLKIRWTLALAG